MAINQKSNNDTTKQSLVQIANQSFDQEFQVTVVEPLGYDGGNLQRTNASNLSLKIQRDGAGNPIYLGISAPGSLSSESKWQIRKLTFDGANNLTAIQYANGSSNFDSIWDDRATLSYT